MTKPWGKRIMIRVDLLLASGERQRFSMDRYEDNETIEQMGMSRIHQESVRRFEAGLVRELFKHGWFYGTTIGALQTQTEDAGHFAITTETTMQELGAITDVSASSPPTPDTAAGR